MPAIRQRTVALHEGGVSLEQSWLVEQVRQASDLRLLRHRRNARGVALPRRTSHREVRLRRPVPEIRFSSSSTAGSGDTRRGGFMQRFLTFVVLLLLTVPVGFSLGLC